MIILASDGISETKRCQHEADHCYQSFNRQHPLSPPFPDSLSGFYVNGGSQSLRRGLTAYHPGSPKEMLPHFDRKFNRIHFPGRKSSWLYFQHHINITRKTKRLKIPYFTGFSVQMSIIPAQSSQAAYSSDHTLPGSHPLPH